LLIRNTEALGSILLWLIGSLNGRVWTHWALLWPWALVALPLGLLSAGLANALQLGDEIAGGLGLAIERARAVLLAIAVLLTAGAIAVVGAIGFVGLIGPHLARRLVGEDARRVFPVSVVLSAGLLLGADTLAQLLTLNPPFATTPYRAGLPVGAVTALLGAPFFLYLLRQKQL
jgi:iron complex transport system permease protein